MNFALSFAKENRFRMIEQIKNAFSSSVPEAEQKLLDDQGIVHSVRNVSDLEEAAGAYKDIAVVMDNQSDLVNIVVELSPLAVIKA